MRKIFIAAVAAAALTITACVKEAANDFTGPIRFTVSTTYENGLAVKTDYSGKDQTGAAISSSSTYERIDWLSTDKIRILCQQASLSSGSCNYADYSVNPSTEGGGKNTAVIEPVEDNGLQWGSGIHHFYAFYPSVLQNPEATIKEGNADRVSMSGVIPAAQTVTLDGHTFKPDMDYAYMYAEATASPGNDISLSFKPCFTAVEFTLLADPDDPVTSNLTSVTLSSTQTDSYLAGSFRLSLSSRSFPVCTVSGGSNSVTIDLTATVLGGVQLSETEACKVTFLMLPQDQTELTLALTFAGGDTTSLQLKDNGAWITIPACTKTYIWNLKAPESTLPSYVFAITDPDDLFWSGGTSTAGRVVSYKYKGRDTTNVAWEVEGYYTSMADAEARTNPVEKDSTMISSFAHASTAGSSAGESVTIGYSKGTGSSIAVDLISAIAATLKSDTGAYVRRGSQSSYWNLANPSTGSTSSIAETANTYIVNAPGYYCFPLVMGNGVKNNANNTSAYQQSNFVNYKGTALTEVTSPYLQDQGGVPTTTCLIWAEVDCIDVQDETSWELSAPSGESSAITSSTVNGQQVYWLNFHVGDNIDQGCALIAVKDASGEVMWSWMIWITDYVPRNYPDYNPYSDMADVSYSPAVGDPVVFMPRNLGWCGTSMRGISYAASSVYVRLKQTGTSNHAVMTVTKPAGSEITENAGHCPMFQWGRKDPSLLKFFQSSPVSVAGLISYSTHGYEGGIQENYKKTILSPWCYFGVSSTYDQQYYMNIYNFWDAGNGVNAWGNSARDVTPVKTIYDPCPAGYSVPRKNAFSGFSTNTLISVGTPNTEGYGRKFGLSLFFPTGIYRSESYAIYFLATAFNVACPYYLRIYRNNVVSFNEGLAYGITSAYWIRPAVNSL